MRKFQRTVENFICGQCGAAVRGNGYTNHCPACLYSRHVDVNPGDRASECGGLMKPVAVEVDKDNYRILHRCIVCGHEKVNKTAPEDSFGKLLEIMAGRAEESKT